MANSKKTRRSLIVCAIVLVMCASMFVGSTYAWFTDSVQSVGNTIQSGNLDVDLVDVDGNSLTGDGTVLEFVDLDDNDLWEPGCTYVLNDVYVKNNGSLALKYEILINGVTGDAKLLEAIEWTVAIDGAEAEEIDLVDLTGYLLPGEMSKAIAITGHMKEEAGNEYQDLTLDGVSISVYATQYTYESDSFNELYDEDAVYADHFVTDAASLADAIAEGGSIVLKEDIVVDETTFTVAADKKVVLDLNGNDISYTTANANASNHLFIVKGEMTITGEGTITLTDTTGEAFSESYQSTPISVSAGTLTLNKGVTVRAEAGARMGYAVDVNTTNGESVLNVNGAELSSSYIGVRIFNNNKTEKGIVNYNSGVISGDKNGYDIWVQDLSKPAENAVVNIADGITYTAEDLSGVMYYVD